MKTFSIFEVSQALVQSLNHMEEHSFQSSGVFSHLLCLFVFYYFGSFGNTKRIIFFFSTAFSLILLFYICCKCDHDKSVQKYANSLTVCYFYSSSLVEMFFLSIKSFSFWLVTPLVHTEANPGAVALQPLGPPSALCPSQAFNQTVSKSFMIGKDFLGTSQKATYLVCVESSMKHWEIMCLLNIFTWR